MLESDNNLTISDLNKLVFQIIEVSRYVTYPALLNNYINIREEVK